MTRMTPLPIVEILTDAVEEAREAREWYGERSIVAARRFEFELDRAIQAIRETPKRWPTHVYGTRRYLLNRFPFLIVYREFEDRIQVIAVQHGKRRPGYWRGRLG
jgi:plasmid stabilization system protein ParE